MSNLDELGEAHATGFQSGYTLALRDAGEIGVSRWPAARIREHALAMAVHHVGHYPLLKREDETSFRLGYTAEYVDEVEARVIALADRFAEWLKEGVNTSEET